MTDEYKSTRLGDLLVERGAITRQQLAHAIELQQLRRQHAIKMNMPGGYTQELGEILVELSFINRDQLKSSLSWQKRLRKTTAAMVFIAPLLTAACGGGSGGSGTNNVQALAQHSQAALDPAVDKPAFSSAFSTSSSGSPDIKSSSIAVASSSSFSSVPAIFQSSSTGSSSTAAILSGPVQIYWTAPNQREDGSFLDVTEIGGYELRYKRKSDTNYSSVIFKDSYMDAYYFDSLQGDYEFQIAAFDIYGVYSAFVQIKPM